MINKYALLKVIKGIIRENNEFSLREVARKIGIGTSTAKETLDFLLMHDILEKRIIGKTHLFRIKSNFLTKSIKVLYSLSEISASKLVEEFITKNPGISSIVLYGSVAKGEDDNKSDIDILIISEKKAFIFDLKAERSLSRELTILNYSYKDWKQKAEKDKVFYYNVISDCIPLYGEKPVVM